MKLMLDNNCVTGFSTQTEQVNVTDHNFNRRLEGRRTFEIEKHSNTYLFSENEHVKTYVDIIPPSKNDIKSFYQKLLSNVSLHIQINNAMRFDVEEAEIEIYHDSWDCVIKYTFIIRNNNDVFLRSQELLRNNFSHF